MNYKRLGVIGGGVMAQAIINGAMNKSVWADEVCVSNPHLEKLALMRTQGVKLTTDNREAAQFADVILIAVKPQNLTSVLDEVADLLPGKTVVSIVAGTSRKWLQERLPKSYIITVMPNLPLTRGQGATAITPIDNVPQDSYRFVSALFMSAGGVFILPEDKMNDVIPLSGSSPAFFFRIVDAMAQESARNGIPYDMASKMAAQTMLGCAEMLLRDTRTPAALVREVCTEGGTTAAAMTAFDEYSLEGLFSEAFKRCIARAEEIGR